MALSRLPPPPDFFKPQGSRPGVRRLNNLPFFIMGGMVVIVVSAIAYSAYQRQPGGSGAKSDSSTDVGRSVMPSEMFAHAPPAGSIDVRKPEPPPAPAPVPAGPAVPAPAAPAAVPQKSAEERAREQAWIAYRNKMAEFAAREQASIDKAVIASPSVEFTAASDAAGAGAGAAGLTSGLAASLKQAGLGGTGATRPGASGTTLDAANRQSAKEDFLKTHENAADRVYGSVVKAASPYEMRAGMVIPAAMISGINSDLPGMLFASVRENVYDTATGDYLLIPQGSRLIGRYDNAIAYGQERVLVVWNRIIFPDASALDLEGMPGADEGGYSGFYDQVDNHYLRVFGSAALMSVLSAAAQLSQPQATNGQNITPGQTLAGSMGQEMTQTGRQIIERNLNIQPTLIIRVGYQFNVMVNKDVIFPGPYVEKNTQLAAVTGETVARPRSADSIPLAGPQLVGWRLRGAVKGKAWVVAPGADALGPFPIYEDHDDPLLGHIDAIVARQGQCVVQTSKGWFAEGGC